MHSWQQNLLFITSGLHVFINTFVLQQQKSDFSTTILKPLSCIAEVPKQHISPSNFAVLLAIIEKKISCIQKETISDSLKSQFSLMLTVLPQLSPTLHDHSHQKFSTVKPLTCFGRCVLPSPYLSWQVRPNKNKAECKIPITVWIWMMSGYSLVCMEYQILKSIYEVTRGWIIYRNPLKTPQ